MGELDIDAGSPSNGVESNPFAQYFYLYRLELKSCLYSLFKLCHSVPIRLGSI